MTDRGQGRFDGIPVTIYAGKFSGAFDMDAGLGEEVAYDDVVCFLVVATADKAAIDSNNGGDLRRTNTFAVNSVHVVPPKLAQQVINTVDGIQDVQLEFKADHTTGELIPSTPDDAVIDYDEEDVFVPSAASAERIADAPKQRDAELSKFLDGPSSF